MVIKATVRDGRIVVDEPTELPEGTVLSLVVDDVEDEMSEEEIAKLNESIAISMAQIEAGQVVPAQQVIDELKKLRNSR